MSITRIFTFFIALFICTPCAFALQANTPEAALEEMVTADTLDGVIKHFPLKVQEAIEKLGAKEKKQVADKIVIRNAMGAKGITLHKRDDGSWEVKNEKQELEGIVTLKNSFVSGTEALVVLEANESNQPDAKDDAPRKVDVRRVPMLASMRLQEGEWRLVAFGPWEPKSLESEDTLRRFGLEPHGESTAESTLRMLNTVLGTYKSLYPEAGYPDSLQALSGPEGAEASAQHAMMLDPSYAAAPLVIDGYRFQYTLLDPGKSEGHQGAYRITATPVEFSPNGGRSLFTDQTRMIRATSEQRDADENDELLGGRE